MSFSGRLKISTWGMILLLMNEPCASIFPFSKVAKDCQKLPKIAKVAKSCQGLPKNAKRCQKMHEKERSSKILYLFKLR